MTTTASPGSGREPVDWPRRIVTLFRRVRTGRCYWVMNAIDRATHFPLTFVNRAA